MSVQFLHGIETVEISNGIRPIQTVKSSIIGIIGTAPDADVAAFPLDTPVLVLNPRDTSSLGETGTIAEALDAIFARVWAWCVVVRVEQGANSAETMSNIVGDATQMTGVHAFLKSQNLLGVTPRILIAPGFTSVRPADSVASIAVGAQGSGYTSAPTVTFSGGGTEDDKVLPRAHAIVAGGNVTSIVVDFPGDNMTAPPTIAFSGGGGSNASATATLGAVANPVVSALLGLAPRLRAVVIADGPGTTRAAAVTYANDWGSDRLYIVDPMALVWDVVNDEAVTKPAAPYVAGLIAYMDNTKGFWWSPSNQELYGVLGPSRPVDFRWNDANSEANFLNEKKIATIVVAEGVRLWGNRTTSIDPLWAFLSVRRTADMVYESVEAAMRWTLDRPISKNSLLEIQESVRQYLKHLALQGAIINGDAWVDPTINSPSELVQGHVYIDYDIEPPAPIERLTFRASRNSGYYTELVAQVVRSAQIGAA